MPAKLQVDECFAFLFCCIEASGCRIDFRLVGDATDLQPAAARMRYSRLKKAVESGHFKGAIVPQGPVHNNRHLAVMANPESQRLAMEASGTKPGLARQLSNNATSVDCSDDFGTCIGDASHTAGSGKTREDEDVMVEVLDMQTAQGQQRKRKASTGPLSEGDDESLFYSDTSNASRFAKHVRGEYNADQAEEAEGDDATYNPKSLSKRSARPQTRQRKMRNHPSAAPNVISDSDTQRDSNDTATYVDPRAYAEPFEDFQRNALRKYSANYNHNASAQRQPRDAQPSLHSVGIVSGQSRPTQEDLSFAQATGQYPMWEIGQRSAPVHTPAVLRNNYDITGTSQAARASSLVRRSPPYNVYAIHQSQRNGYDPHLNPASILDNVEPPRQSRFAVPTYAQKSNIYTNFKSRNGASRQLSHNDIVIGTGAGAIDPQLQSGTPRPSSRPVFQSPAQPASGTISNPAAFSSEPTSQQSMAHSHIIPGFAESRAQTVPPRNQPPEGTTSRCASRSGKANAEAEAAETLNAMAQGEAADTEMAV